MKEMVYKDKVEHDLLYFGKKGDYNIEIVSNGLYPCAYVSIPPTHPYYRKSLNEISGIECHFGLTFSCPDNLSWSYSQVHSEECSWIGWDYAHAGDYIGLVEILGTRIPESILSGKKWTTKEILNECYQVIKQLEQVKEL